MPPHGYLNGVLAFGFSAGVGDFVAHIELRDSDSSVLWTRPEPWPFTVGQQAAAVYAEPIERWLRKTGGYYFLIRVEPSGMEHQIHFEVTDSPGPAREAEQPDADDAE